MYDVTMDLTSDWIDTAKEVLRSAGYEFPEGAEQQTIAEHYFELSLPQDRAVALAAETLARLKEIEETMIGHLGDVVVPDIRQRTGYTGNAFHFCWVYHQGEHIVEMHSEYRIPLGP